MSRGKGPLRWAPQGHEVCTEDRARESEKTEQLSTTFHKSSLFSFFLMLNEPLFSWNAATVATKLPAACNNTVAVDNDGDLVSAVGIGNSATRRWFAHGLGLI